MQGAAAKQLEKQCILHRVLMVSNERNSVLCIGSWW